MRILAVQRAERYSPNSVDKDSAIMRSVVRHLCNAGHQVSVVSEDSLLTADDVSWQTVFSMGRSEETLQWLRSLQVPVINAPDGVARCHRSTLQQLMLTAGVPVAPRKGSDGYWLKRGDGCAQSPDDVVYAATDGELEAKLNAFRCRGIHDYVVSAHVVGDVVKFYGVVSYGGKLHNNEASDSFFRCYYPADDGETKYGDERHNGQAHHYAFNVAALQRVSEHLAAIVGISVFGGDCIVRADGTFCIIDFNDWPSFSRCREEAAVAIAALAGKKERVDGDI